MKMILPTLFLATVAQAQPATQAPAAVQSACAPFAAVPLPADIASLSAPKVYPVCDPYAFYQARLFIAARTCAVEQRNAQLAHLTGASGEGLIFLTQIYANADHVPRNPALAGRFFCEAVQTGEVASNLSELSKILATLTIIATLTQTSAELSFCNAMTGAPTPNTPQTLHCHALAAQSTPSSLVP